MCRGVAYIGIDNRAARAAGGLSSRAVHGRQPLRQGGALLPGSLSYRGHEEREMGFRHILAEERPKPADRSNCGRWGDDRERAYAEATALLDRHRESFPPSTISAAGNYRHRQGRSRSAAVSIRVVFLGHEIE